MDKSDINAEFYAATSQKMGYVAMLILFVYQLRNGFLIANDPTTTGILYWAAIALIIFMLFLIVTIVAWLFRSQKPTIKIANGEVVIIPIITRAKKVSLEEITDVTIEGKTVSLKKANGKLFVIRIIRLLKKEDQDKALDCFRSLSEVCQKKAT